MDLDPKTQSFMGLEIELFGEVLVPRQETELLANKALSLFEPDAPLSLVDMCCGSGNLALTLAQHYKQSRVYGCDLTDGCVACARRNAERLKLDGRLTILQGDLFGALCGYDLEGQLDLVVCNPPYISSGRLEKDRAELLKEEPREAFDGGPYGISIHQRVVKEASRFLKPDGWLAFEFGEGQHAQAKRLLTRSGDYQAICLINNENAIPRVAIAQRKNLA